MVNINRPQFDDHREWDGFTARRAKVGKQAGAERLGASLWEVGPGEAAYPYHMHLGEEELLIVFEGRPSIRTPDGWRDHEPGDVISFPVGEEGAHQLVNRTGEMVRFLAISTSGAPEIVIQLDSGKVGAFDRRPGREPATAHWFHPDDARDYVDGVPKPEAP
jgi:uncharacterized cupin superfamily protein